MAIRSREMKDLGTQVAEQLAAELLAGRWGPGDLLPKETELCERFRMSRPSVRSGLQMLTSLGIVRRVSGHGTVVEAFEDWNLLDPLMTQWMAQHDTPNPRFLSDIFAFRHAVEPYVSAMAARAATARDLLAMEEAFIGMEATVRSDVPNLADSQGKTYSDYDVEFHAAIYRATHNIIWTRMAHILRPAILLVVRTSNATAEELRDSLERHRHLMECIRLRRAEETFEAALGVMARTAYDLGLEKMASEDADLLAKWKGQVGPMGPLGNKNPRD
ncbi:FadR/GntR family transcriptional regulator [Rhodospirillum sp. A1_3_36]|uniref:FadR/GntR family transcriptional regulator n=1 Tax=Rhodospirillum sp. A1_3_36 TaxID=3391666 RepID=UPI0039A56C83